MRSLFAATLLAAFALGAQAQETIPAKKIQPAAGLRRPVALHAARLQKPPHLAGSGEGAAVCRLTLPVVGAHEPSQAGRQQEQRQHDSATCGRGRGGPRGASDHGGVSGIEWVSEPRTERVFERSKRPRPRGLSPPAYSAALPARLGLMQG